MAETPASRTEGIPDSRFPGPYPVGAYAAQLKRRLQEFARVQLVGEVLGFRAARARVYFELRDGHGALPCSMWLTDFEALGVRLTDGMRIVVGGGCDYYPGSAVSSPSFSFAVTELRPAGEGDLLVALERLRRRLHADGLFEPQKRACAPAAAADHRGGHRRARARPATTCWPGCAVAAGAGAWCGPSRPSRTVTPPLGSPPPCVSWRRSTRSRW